MAMMAKSCLNEARTWSATYTPFRAFLMSCFVIRVFCCACLRERADAVQERLLRILNHSSNGGGNGHNGNGSSKSSSSGAFAGLGPYAGRRRPAGSDVGGGFQVGLTHRCCRECHHRHPCAVCVRAWRLCVFGVAAPHAAPANNTCIFLAHHEHG